MPHCSNFNTECGEKICLKCSGNCKEKVLTLPQIFFCTEHGYLSCKLDECVGTQECEKHCINGDHGHCREFDCDEKECKENVCVFHCMEEGHGHCVEYECINDIHEGNLNYCETHCEEEGHGHPSSLMKFS